MTPVSITDALEVVPIIEAPPAIEFGIAIEVTGPSIPPSPSAKARVLEPPIEGEKEVEKKKTKRILRKSQ